MAPPPTFTGPVSNFTLWALQCRHHMDFSVLASPLAWDNGTGELPLPQACDSCMNCIYGNLELEERLWSISFAHQTVPPPCESLPAGNSATMRRSLYGMWRFNLIWRNPKCIKRRWPLILHILVNTYSTDKLFCQGWLPRRTEKLATLRLNQALIHHYRRDSDNWLGRLKVFFSLSGKKKEISMWYCLQNGKRPPSH